MRIITIICILLLTTFAYGSIEKPSILIEKNNGKIVGWGYTRFENNDKAKYDVIEEINEIELLQQENLEYLEYKNGKLKRKSYEEINEIIQKKKQEKEKAEKELDVDLVAKLKELGFTNADVKDIQENNMIPVASGAGAGLGTVGLLYAINKLLKKKSGGTNG